MPKYTMRPLKTSDIFKMSKILKKLEVKSIDVIKSIDINSIVSKGEEEQKKAGLLAVVALVQKAAENLYRAEDEVNSLLGELVGITGEEFGEIPIEETLEIISLFKEQKGLANFLKLAGK